MCETLCVLCAYLVKINYYVVLYIFCVGVPFFFVELMKSSSCRPLSPSEFAFATMQSMLSVLVLACVIAAVQATAYLNHIYWNITVSAPKVNKQILQSVIGCSKKGSLHAILGPSGIIHYCILGSLFLLTINLFILRLRKIFVVECFSWSCSKELSAHYW